MDETIRRIVERHGLEPHPEGGFYRETWRATEEVEHPRLEGAGATRRAAGTCIVFLLPAGDFSAFHRVVPTDETWHLYAGGPLELHTIDEGGSYAMRVLTTDVAAGEPTALVKAGTWQAARPAEGADWAFGGCTVSPGFQFEDFEMPPRAELIRRFPRHEAILRELTKR